MNSHLTPRELLHYVDGELPARQSRSAQAHLRSCWHCRTELERLEQDINLIVNAQDLSYFPAMPPPPRPWANFEEMAATLPSRFRICAWLQRANFLAHLGSVTWAATVVTLVCVLVTALWLTPARLSAEGVFRNLDAADLVRTRVARGQAVRQRVRVQRVDRHSSVRGRSMEFEFWTFGALSRWRGEDNDLHRLYRNLGIDTVLPLSAPACERWLSETGAKPKVSVSGGAVELRADGEGRDLESVSVRVSSDGWHVAAMRLTFSDSIFDLSELDLTVLRKDELPPELLETLEPPSPANSPHAKVERTTGSTGKIAAMELSADAPTVNLSEVELRVQFRLHEIGADLSEPIELKLEPPRVVISAAGASQGRKQQLVEMFDNDPRLRLDIDARAALSEGPFTPVGVPGPTPQSAPDKQLEAFFGGLDAEERFTRAVLAIDESILDRLYALRNLAERWPPEAEATLSDEARGELRGIAEDHRSALRADLPRLRELLTPLIESFCNGTVPSTGNPGAPVPWREFAAIGLSAAPTLDRYLRASLTTSANATNIGEACPNISGALSSLEWANLPAVK